MKTDERPPMANTHADVMRKVVNSVVPVCHAASHFLTEFEVYIPQTQTAMTWEERRLFRDKGDLFVRKDGECWRRVEVKAPQQAHWTCREDFPYAQMFLSNVRVLGRKLTGPPKEGEFSTKPSMFFIFNDTFEHAGLVDWLNWETWKIHPFTDPHSKAPGESWSVLPKFVEFVHFDLGKPGMRSMVKNVLAFLSATDKAQADDDEFGAPGPAALHGHDEPRGAVPERAAAR